MVQPYYSHLVKQFHTLKWETPYQHIGKLSLHDMIRTKSLSLPAKPNTIGSGVYGSAFELKECCGKNCTNKSYVIKVVKLGNGINRMHVIDEAHRSKLDKAAMWGAVCHLYTFFKHDGEEYGVMLIDHVLRKYPIYQLSTLTSFVKTHGVTVSLKDEIERLFKMFYETPKVHGDLHGNNMLVIHDQGRVISVKIIDFFTMKTQRKGNTAVKFVKGESALNRMIASNKLVLQNRVKRGNVQEYKNQYATTKVVDYAPDYKVMRLYYNVTGSKRNTPALMRSNIALFSASQPELMKHIVSRSKNTKAVAAAKAIASDMGPNKVSNLTPKKKSGAVKKKSGAVKKKSGAVKKKSGAVKKNTGAVKNKSGAVKKKPKSR